MIFYLIQAPKDFISIIWIEKMIIWLNYLANLKSLVVLVARFI